MVINVTAYHISPYFLSIISSECVSEEIPHLCFIAKAKDQVKVFLTMVIHDVGNDWELSLPKLKLLFRIDGTSQKAIMPHFMLNGG